MTGVGAAIISLHDLLEIFFAMHMYMYASSPHEWVVATDRVRAWALATPLGRVGKKARLVVKHVVNSWIHSLSRLS